MEFLFFCPVFYRYGTPTNTSKKSSCHIIHAVLDITQDTVGKKKTPDRERHTPASMVCCEIRHDAREPRLAGNSGFWFLGLHPHTQHLRWKDRNFSYHVQEKRPAHEVPDDVIACHLLVTVGSECHQQVGTHDGQTAANEG